MEEQATAQPETQVEPTAILPLACSVSQPLLAKALSTVGKFAAQRSTMPILTHVLLASHEEGYLSVSACNLESGAVCFVPAFVTSTGMATVPAKLLSDWTNAMPNQAILLTGDLDKQAVTLKCGRYRTVMKGENPDHFPPVLPEQKDANPVQLFFKPSDLAFMLAAVSCAASEEESAYALTGINFVVRDGTLCLSATDRYRMALYTHPDKLDVGDVAVVVPAKTLIELTRVAEYADPDKPIVVTLYPSRVTFELTGSDDSFASATLATQTIDSKIINLARFIPQEHQTRVSVATTDLLRALKVANLYARDANDLISLHAEVLDTEGVGKLGLMAQSESGLHEGDLDVGMAGEEVRLGTNAQFLKDSVTAIKTATTLLDFSGATKPIVVRPDGDERYVHVLMPMQPRPRYQGN